MKMSIIIPVYNTDEKALCACIESAINQTCSDIEVIIVDDGSTDESALICDRYLYDKRVNVIHTENSGVSNARNVGIDNAKSPFIIFMDADDILNSDVCEKCYEVMSKNDYDILVFKLMSNGTADSYCISEIPEESHKKLQLRIIDHTDKRDGFIYGSIWCKVFKRDFLINNNVKFTLGMRRSQDRLFMIEALEYKPIIALFDYRGYGYIYNSGSVTNKYNPNVISILHNSYKEFERFVASKHNNDNDFVLALYQLALKFTYSEIELYYLNKKRKVKIRQQVEELKALFEKMPLSEALKYLNVSEIEGGKTKIVYYLIKRKKYYIAIKMYKMIDMFSSIKRKLK